MSEKRTPESGGKIRINKYLSDTGVCSRRDADKLIGEGRVEVNGEKAVCGQKISSVDIICVDGKKVVPGKKEILLLFYKPVGIVCSTKQQFSETTVIQYLKFPKRIYPVGRLDKDSEGLLLMTNEGDLVNQILRAGNYHEKEYLVKVDHPVTEAFLEQMRNGVPILNTVTRPCSAERTGTSSFRIILTQGLNRQIRRMCEYLGYRVTHLKRVRIMNLTLGNLKPGEYREITPGEKEKLYAMLTGSTSRPASRQDAAQTGGKTKTWKS